MWIRTSDFNFIRRDFQPIKLPFEDDRLNLTNVKQRQKLKKQKGKKKKKKTKEAICSQFTDPKTSFIYIKDFGSFLT
jgi:hypothetical protein